MKSADQIKMEEKILKDIADLRVSLNDSPISFAHHLNFNRGYYVGVCFAKNWDTDPEVMSALQS